jgi:hypothetical protein
MGGSAEVGCVDAQPQPEVAIVALAALAGILLHN